MLTYPVSRVLQHPPKILTQLLMDAICPTLSDELHDRFQEFKGRRKCPQCHLTKKQPALIRARDDGAYHVAKNPLKLGPLFLKKEKTVATPWEFPKNPMDFGLRDTIFLQGGGQNLHNFVLRDLLQIHTFHTSTNMWMPWVFLYRVPPPKKKATQN